MEAAPGKAGLAAGLMLAGCGKGKNLPAGLDRAVVLDNGAGRLGVDAHRLYAGDVFQPGLKIEAVKKGIGKHRATQTDAALQLVHNPHRLRCGQGPAHGRAPACVQACMLAFAQPSGAASPVIAPMT